MILLSTRCIQLQACRRFGRLNHGGRPVRCDELRLPSSISERPARTSPHRGRPAGERQRALRNERRSADRDFFGLAGKDAMTRFAWFLILLLVVSAFPLNLEARERTGQAQTQAAVQEPQPVTTANYDQAGRFAPYKIDRLIYSTAVRPRWIDDGSDRFWYEWETSGGKSYLPRRPGSRHEDRHLRQRPESRPN